MNFVKFSRTPFLQNISVRLFLESPEMNLFRTDDAVQLLLESVKNFKTQKVCGSIALFDPTTRCFFLRHNSISLHQMQNYFLVVPKL